MENEIRNTEKQIKKINEIENDAWFVRDLEFVVLKKMFVFFTKTISSRSLATSLLSGVFPSLLACRENFILN